MKTIALFAVLLAVLQDPKPPSLRYGNPRESKEWIELPSGVSVAVDEGIEWKGAKAYLSLTGDLVVVDSATGKTRWAQQVGAYWNRLTFEEVGEPKAWAVALRPDNGERVQHHDLKTGAIVGELPKPPPGKPLAPKTWSGSTDRGDAPWTGLVTTAEHWKTVRGRLFEGAKSPGEGEIDFAKDCLLVVYSGRSSNCNGISANSAFEDDARLLLRLRHHTYQSMGEGAVERPYGIFVLPRLGKKPLVLEVNAQSYLHGPPIWKEFRRLEAGDPAKELDGLPE